MELSFGGNHCSARTAGMVLDTGCVNGEQNKQSMCEAYKLVKESAISHIIALVSV